MQMLVECYVQIVYIPHAWFSLEIRILTIAVSQCSSIYKNFKFLKICVLKVNSCLYNFKRLWAKFDKYLELRSLFKKYLIFAPIGSEIWQQIVENNLNGEYGDSSWIWLKNKHILNSVWSAQHSNAGQNIQQIRVWNWILKCYDYLKIVAIFKLHDYNNFLRLNLAWSLAMSYSACQQD